MRKYHWGFLAAIIAVSLTGNGLAQGLTFGNFTNVPQPWPTQNFTNNWGGFFSSLSNITTNPFPQQQQGGTYFTYTEEEKRAIRNSQIARDTILTKELVGWDEVAMDIVKRRGMGPTVAAKFYSHLTMGHREVMLLAKEVGGSSKKAIDLISTKVICKLAAEDCQSVQRFASTDGFAVALANPVFKRLEEKLAQDSADTTPLTRPTGDGIWTGENPAAPETRLWKTWFDQSAVTTPASPAFGSAQDLQEVQAVRDALRNLTAYQFASLVYWAGSKGSETPGGIWLKIADHLLKDKNVDAEKAADIRAKLMMAVHDAFILCWKAKFTYWTARPNQRDTSIQTVIPTPPFPSYPSGHATISGAASKVMTSYFPHKGNLFNDYAEEAAEGRVWAGIHFPIDSDVGLEVGKKVAENVLAMRRK